MAARKTPQTEPTGAAVLEGTDVEQVESDADKDHRLKNRLRGQAERTVLENHREEYYAECKKLFEAAGLEFTRRLTAEEKAEQELEKMLEQFPALRGKYQKVEADEAPVAADDIPAEYEGPVDEYDEAYHVQR